MAGNRLSLLAGLVCFFALTAAVMFLAGNSAKAYAEDAQSEDELLVPAGYGETLSDQNTEEDQPKDEAVVKGSYRINFGVEGDDFIWKDANYLLQEGSWRYFYGEKRYNTYDPAIFSRFSISIDAPIEEKFSFYMKVVVDPWSFVGTTQAITLPTAYGTTPDVDTIGLKLKYWSNSGRIYPEIVRSAQGDSFALPEIKVVDGHTQAASVNGNFGYYTHRVDIPELKIDREFKPLRAFWFDVKEDEYRAVVFLYAEENIAMDSDDPLQLVNNHIVWEPSPWLAKWQAGKLYTATGWENGVWQNDLSLRDSENNWLTLLRAVRVEGECAGIYCDGMIAAPLDPWDDYDIVNNIPLALRFKKDITDQFLVGSTYTSRWGYGLGSLDAADQALALDTAFMFNEYHTLKAETALSKAERNLNNNDFEVSTDDDAYKVVLESAMDPFELEIVSKLSYTVMGRDFQPPLASYAYTRDDLAWGRHIAFFLRSEREERYRIGDGIDRDRKVLAADMRFGELEGVTTYFNLRGLTSATDDSFLENILRNETSYQANEQLLTKFLFIYDNRKKNSAGLNPDTYTVSGAFKYDFTQWLSWEEIVERTNEYPGFPDGIYSWLTINPEPPYPYYTITSSRLILTHDGWLEFALEQTYNEFKYATTIDDFMNYSGFQMQADLNDRLTVGAVYRYSHVADFGRNGKVIGHHNVYWDIRYQVNEDAHVLVRFGSLGSYVEGLGWKSSVLDTQHLLQILYEGKF